MKENGYIIPSFEDFVFLKEHLLHTNVRLETGKQNDRLINHIAILDESSYSEFDALTEQERYQLDDAMWECILEAAITDEQLNEGFFKKIISGVKELPKKSLNYAKKIISNVGQLFKDLANYVKQFLAACAEKAESVASKLWSEIKEKAEKKLSKKLIIVESDDLNEGEVSAKAASEELAHFKECKEFLKNKAVKQALKDNFGSTKEAMKDVATASKEEAPEMINKINKELKGDKQKTANESFVKDIITKAINEIRSNENFDLTELLSVAEFNTFMNEGGAESAAEAGEEKKKSVLKKIKDNALSLQGIVSIMLSGVTWLFEQVTSALSNGALNKYAKRVEKAGGPSAIEYVAIGTIIAAIVGFAVEVYATVFGGEGHEIANKIAHGLHAGNPSYWLSVAGDALIGGTITGKVIRGTALAGAAVIGATHILHSIKGHEHMEDKESDKDKDDKEKEEK